MTGNSSVTLTLLKLPKSAKGGLNGNFDYKAS